MFKMKFARTTIHVVYFTSTIHAHYFFPNFIVNNTITPRWKYVRDVAMAYPPVAGQYESPKTDPLRDIYSPDITCGRNAFAAAGTTETATVIAGEEVGFRVSNGGIDEYASSAQIFHTGPAQAYLAKPPNGKLEDFSGIEGDWVKIESITSTGDRTSWITFSQNSVNFTIPAKTPPGKYLLRFEHFWPQVQWNTSQWYVNCAHIDIISNGETGSFDSYPFAKFPGAYDLMDPGIWISVDIDRKKDLSKYVAPGPAVWTG